MVGNRECNTERGFKNQLYIERAKLTFVDIALSVKAGAPLSSLYCLDKKDTPATKNGTIITPSTDFDSLVKKVNVFCR